MLLRFRENFVCTSVAENVVNRAMVLLAGNVTVSVGSCRVRKFDRSRFIQEVSTAHLTVEFWHRTGPGAQSLTSV